MLHQEKFAELSGEQEKQYLLAIFQQITRSSEEIEEIRTLLSSDFPFSVETLQTVYATLSKIVSAGKEQHASQLKEQFHTIHQKLEQESADAGVQADELLKEAGMGNDA